MKKTKKLKGKKYYGKKCMDLWLYIVKARRNYECEKCPKTRSDGFQMHAHHIYNRVHYKTRYDLSNGLCLCAECHSEVEHPTFHIWLKKYLPKEQLERLASIYKISPQRSVQDYVDLWEELKREKESLTNT